MSPLEFFGGTASLARLASLLFVAGCDATVVSVGAWVLVPADGAADAASRDSSPDAKTADVSPDNATTDAPADDDVRIDGGGNGLYLEAEDGLLSGGFTIGDDPLASAGKFIAPPMGASDGQPGLARAVYEFDITAAGPYLIWGRIHSPDANHNRAWVQVDGGTWYLWRITTGDIWYWNYFHDNNKYYTPLVFDLTEGRHEIVLANAIDGIGIDRLYVGPQGEPPPQTETPCRPPDSIPVLGACVPSCGSLSGQSCGTTFCAGRTLITQKVYDCVVCCL